MRYDLREIGSMYGVIEEIDRSIKQEESLV
jgi:hypothetical protein